MALIDTLEKETQNKSLTWNERNNESKMKYKVYIKIFTQKQKKGHLFSSGDIDKPP